MTAGRKVLRRTVLGTVTVVVSFCAMGGRDAGAVDFLRADANSDGAVSISDAHAILFYLFHGGPMRCRDAADADDDGRVSLADSVVVLNFVVGSGVAPPPPFPRAGADPTPDRERELDCASYGDGSPLDDALARIEVLDTVAEGGDDGMAHIVLAVTNTTPIAGYSATLSFDPALISGVHEARSLFPDLKVTTNVDAGALSLGVLNGLVVDPVTVPSGQSVPLAELSVCLREGIPAGEYSLALSSGELVDAELSRAIQPALTAGGLSVLSDVAASDACEEPEEPDPVPINAEFALSGGFAHPGETAPVDFFMRADAAIQGYAFSVDFEEDVIRAVEVEQVWEKPDGSEYSFSIYEINNERAKPGNEGVDEGFVVGAVVFDWHEPVAMPADTDNLAVRLHFLVDPDTTAESTEIRFVDGGQGSGQPVPNMVTANGDIDYTQDSPGSFIFINGVIGVLPDILVFIRGDSNGDGSVDVSDALTTLGYLFKGEDDPYCFDAADANDDGALNLTDPVVTFEHLFLGGLEPPPPFPGEGEDPTEDGMTCLEKSP